MHSLIEDRVLASYFSLFKKRLYTVRTERSKAWPSVKKKKQKLHSHTEQKDTQKTYAYTKPETVSTSVMQKSKHDSWMMGVNRAVKLHSSDGKHDQVSVSTVSH